MITRSLSKYIPVLSIILGTVFITITVVFVYFNPCLTTSQEHVLRFLVATGIVSFLSFIVNGTLSLTGNLKENWKVSTSGGFALFVILCFSEIENFFPKDNCQDTFSLTVFVKHNGNTLRNIEGKISINFDDDPKTASITNGNAFFRGIPSNFRNRKIKIELESEACKPLKPDSLYLLSLNTKSIEVEVLRKVLE